MRSNFAKILFFLALAALFTLAATRHDPAEFALPVTVETNQSVPQVVLSNTEIIQKGTDHYLVGVLENRSDIPITLGIVELRCVEGENERTYRVTTAVRETAEKIMAPVPVNVNESFVFENKITDFTSENAECTAEIKSWSKYEPQSTAKVQ